MSRWEFMALQVPLNENIATKKRKAVSITGEIQDLVNYKKKNNNKNKKGSMSKKSYHI